ncbi:hypothetical protein Bhyg_08138 [Pseudolycoriella hygida]|uniref:Uncharacterized protein n=1 Tax=Pseudolycoriella hygida TaxID=35572 RepID=A0A9Q0S2P3_9DIPT|nr:hypothetical protein Bhyg_08138 [Pseudolycoriella hygida]
MQRLTGAHFSEILADYSMASGMTKFRLGANILTAVNPTNGFGLPPVIILLIQNAPEKMHQISPPSPVILLRNYLPRSGNSSTTMGTAGSNNNRATHGQIVANIENNSIHYDRDWTLDDSSQSSFKPCPQGSGSMLPFHDSAHNMSENVRNSGEFDSPMASCSGDHHDINQMPNPMKTSDLNLFKVNQRTVGHPPPSSAIFLENSDILNDTDYPRLYQRHSTIFISPERVKDTRRSKKHLRSSQKVERYALKANLSTDSIRELQISYGKGRSKTETLKANDNGKCQ